MTTPAAALSSIMHTVVLCFGVLWVAALLVGRVYAFHEAYTRIQQELANDARLLALCSDLEFVAMMKQHADVCSQVQVDAWVKPWLKALNVALTSPTLCGRETCIELLSRLSIWGGWTGTLTGIAIALCMPQLLFLVFRQQRAPRYYVNTDPNLKPLSYAPLSKEGMPPRSSL